MNPIYQILIISGAGSLITFGLILRWMKKAMPEPEDFTPKIRSTVKPEDCQNIKFPSKNKYK